jgi:dipeptidase
MKKIIVAASLGIILLLSFSVKSWTQNPEIDPHYLTYIGNCTSIMVGRLASIAWFSFDNPALSPRIPIFSGVLRLPSSFGICGQHRYRTDAALWSFRETNRLAAVNWSKGRILIEPAVREFEILASQEMPMVEKRAMELISEGKITEAQEYLTIYTNNFAYATMKKWEELKVTLWGDFRIWYR